MRKSYAIPALLVIWLALALMMASCGGDTGTAPGAPASGAQTTASALRAPDFQGTTIDGGQVSLSLFRGKALVIAFLASW